MTNNYSKTLPHPIAWETESLSGWGLPGYEDFDFRAIPWQTAARKEPLPEGFEFVKRSRSRLVVKVWWRGVILYVKRVLARTWKHRLSAAFQGSKLAREWKVTQQFRDLGITVPEPVLYADDGSRVSYLALRSFPETWKPLAEEIDEAGTCDPFIDELAHLTRWLHDLPAYHDDYRTDHIFRTTAGIDEPFEERFAFLDLDGAFTGVQPSLKRREEALCELFLSLARQPFPVEAAERFGAIYASGSSYEVDARAIHELAIKRMAQHRQI